MTKKYKKDWRDKLVVLIEKEWEKCPQEKNCYLNEILGVVDDLLKKQKEEIIKEIDEIEKRNDSDGRYNACQELKNLLK